MGGSGNLPIGPGIFGFIAAFFLALALWLLMRNMNARMRRMAYRDRASAGPKPSATHPASDGRPPAQGNGSRPAADPRRDDGGGDDDGDGGPGDTGPHRIET